MVVSLVIIDGLVLHLPEFAGHAPNRTFRGGVSYKYRDRECTKSVMGFWVGQESLQSAKTNSKQTKCGKVGVPSTDPFSGYSLVLKAQAQTHDEPEGFFF